MRFVLYKYLYIIRSFCIFAGICFLLLLAYAEYGKDSVDSDYYFLIDVSNSMNVADVDSLSGKISRLEYAKKTIADWILQEEDPKNFGLILFGGEAKYYIVPTGDTDTFLSRLENVNTSLLAGGSSALGDAVALLINTIQPYDRVFIFTDGEDIIQDTNVFTDQEYLGDYIVYIVGSKQGGDVLQANGQKVYNTMGDVLYSSIDSNFLTDLPFDYSYKIVDRYVPSTSSMSLAYNTIIYRSYYMILAVLFFALALMIS